MKSSRKEKLMKVLALLVILLGVASTTNAAGLLDGKSFSGLSGPKGKSGDTRDDLVFTNGMLHSTGCDAYGFVPGPYTAVQRGDAIVFTATTKSPSSGTIDWEGTIRNGTLEATFVWKRALIFRRSYWIKATQK
jgi:hypothetical protein